MDTGKKQAAREIVRLSLLRKLRGLHRTVAPDLAAEAQRGELALAAKAKDATKAAVKAQTKTTAALRTDVASLEARVAALRVVAQLGLGPRVGLGGLGRLHDLAQAGLAVHSYSATQVKRILTGNGRAPKAQILMAIRRELSLKILPDPADVADALAIALCHHYLTCKTIQI